VTDGLQEQFTHYEWQVAAGLSGAVTYRLAGLGREPLFAKVVNAGAATRRAGSGSSRGL
jgi:hypothetical protein